MAAEAVDWPALMRLGLGALGLAPDVFWSMTPGEFRLAAEGAGLVVPAGAGPMGSARLAELMAAFPDTGRAGGVHAMRANDGAVPRGADPLDGARASGGEP